MSTWLALRTQQIIANESGAALTADPLAGSYYVEHLTTQLECRALELLAKVDELGGATRAIEASFFQEEIARSAYEFQLRVENGAAVIIGVNKYADSQEPPTIATPDFTALARDQVDRLRAVKAKRDARRADETVAALRNASRTFVGGDNRAHLMELIVDAVRARASVGEIADALRAEWGTYQP